MLVGQMVVNFMANLTNLTAGVRNGQNQMRNFASTTQSSMSSVAAAQNKAEEAAHKLELAQAQAALALKKASDMANTGKAAAEQQAAANARAAIAADKVRAAEIALSNAQETARTTADALANAEDDVALSEEQASSASGRMNASLQGMHGTLTSTISKVIEFGAHLTTVIGGIKDVAQTALQWGQSLLTPAANMEQIESSLTVFTGSVEKARKEMSELASFSTKTPFETKAIDDAAVKMQGVGISANNVIPYITALGDALDASSKTGSADLDQIVNNFNKIQTTGHLTTEIMQSFADQGVDAWGSLQRQTGKSREELQRLISNGLYPADQAMKDLTEGLENNPLYHGQMANDANVFNGALSTLKSIWDQLLVGFGSPIIKSLEGGISKLSTSMSSPQFQQFATLLGTQVAGGLERVGNFIQTTVIPGFQQLQQWGQNVGKAFQSPEFQQLVSSFQNLGNTVSVTLLPALKPLGDALSHIFSGGGGKEQASGLASAFKTIADAVNGLNSFVIFMRDQVWPSVWPVLVQIGTFLQSTFGPAFTQISNVLQTQLLPAFNRLWIAIQPAMPLLQGLAVIVGLVLFTALALVVAMVTGLASAVANALPGIITWFSGLIQAGTGVFQFFSGLGTFLNDVFTGNFSKLGADLGLIWAGIVNMFFGGLTMIKGLFMTVWGWISGFIGAWVGTIIGFFTNLWNTLVHHSIIPDMINEIVAWFAGLPGRVIALVSRLVSMAIGYFLVMSERARNKVQEMVDGIRNTIASLPGQALQWGQNLVSSFAQGIRNMIGQAGQAAQDVANSVKNFLGIHSPAKEGPLSELMDWPVNLVRSYAGQIRANTPLVERAVDDLVQPTTALNGRAGMNLSASGSGAGTGSIGGGRGQQIIIIELDGDEIGRTVNDYQARELRVQAVVRR